ncbi:hypothetical protein SAY87_005335 [Trapa incisa]|uniref:Uncharacterized protein n=1 Tax=Trapa incisa TaxID=236973 RepID=A0AAN7Q6N4_9MYRT|nr:hypothetical protein SAY87_005335 [Trapa incisa]
MKPNQSAGTGDELKGKKILLELRFSPHQRVPCGCRDPASPGASRPLGVLVVASSADADLVKVRMQAGGGLLSQGLLPRYPGPLDEFRMIVHFEGCGKVFHPMHKGHFLLMRVNSPATIRQNKDDESVKDNVQQLYLGKTLRIEGLRALWKGFLPPWARLGPWQIVFWVSCDRLWNLAGLSSF